MYTDRKSRNPACIVLLLVLLIWALVLAFMLFGSFRSDRTAAAEDAIEQAIRRTAMQCYAVEGVYPPSLAYLQDNYGLQVNTTDYYIIYDAFASNQMPEIRVVAANG